MVFNPAILVLMVAAIVTIGVTRAVLDDRPNWARVFRLWGRIEIAIITTFLLLLTGLGFLQILLRNFFHTGVMWADPFMRHLVLWIGCLGASLATAHVRHINIDVFGRLLPRRYGSARRFVVHGATATAATFLCIAALRLVVDERAFGEIAFLNVQTWVTQSILPVTFFSIAFRSVTNIFLNREHHDDRAEAELSR